MSFQIKIEQCVANDFTTIMKNFKVEIKEQVAAIEENMKNLTDKNNKNLGEMNLLKAKNSEMNKKINSLSLENAELRRLISKNQNEIATNVATSFKPIYFHVGLQSGFSSSANERVKFDIIRAESDDHPYDTQNGRITNIPNIK